MASVRTIAQLQEECKNYRQLQTTLGFTFVASLLALGAILYLMVRANFWAKIEGKLLLILNSCTMAGTLVGWRLTARKVNRVTVVMQSETKRNRAEQIERQKSVQKQRKEAAHREAIERAQAEAIARARADVEAEEAAKAAARAASAPIPAAPAKPKPIPHPKPKPQPRPKATPSVKVTAPKIERQKSNPSHPPPLPAVSASNASSPPPNYSGTSSSSGYAPPPPEEILELSAKKESAAGGDEGALVAEAAAALGPEFGAFVKPMTAEQFLAHLNKWQRETEAGIEAILPRVRDLLVSFYPTEKQLLQKQQELKAIDCGWSLSKKTSKEWSLHKVKQQLVARSVFIQQVNTLMKAIEEGIPALMPKSFAVLQNQQAGALTPPQQIEKLHLDLLRQLERGRKKTENKIDDVMVKLAECHDEKKAISLVERQMELLSSLAMQEDFLKAVTTEPVAPGRLRPYMEALFADERFTDPSSSIMAISLPPFLSHFLNSNSPNLLGIIAETMEKKLSDPTKKEEEAQPDIQFAEELVNLFLKRPVAQKEQRHDGILVQFNHVLTLLQQYRENTRTKIAALKSKLAICEDKDKSKLLLTQQKELISSLTAQETFLGLLSSKKITRSQLLPYMKVLIANEKKRTEPKKVEIIDIKEHPKIKDILGWLSPLYDFAAAVTTEKFRRDTINGQVQTKVVKKAEAEFNLLEDITPEEQELFEKTMAQLRKIITCVIPLADEFLNQFGIINTLNRAQIGVNRNPEVHEALQALSEACASPEKARSLAEKAMIEEATDSVGHMVTQQALTKWTLGQLQVLSVLLANTPMGEVEPPPAQEEEAKAGDAGDQNGKKKKKKKAQS